MSFVNFLLSAALLAALYRLVTHHIAMRSLAKSIRTRQPYLRDKIPGTFGLGWENLRSAANDLVNENNRLQILRSGQMAQLDATLGNIQEAVLIIDQDNYVILTNRAMNAMFPRTENMLHERIELALHSREFLTFITEVRSGQATPQRVIEFMEEDQSICVEATGSLIPSLEGRPEKWALFVLHDVSRQRHLESMRKDFVANVSHELRTPLSIVKGYVETLVDSDGDMSPKDRIHFLKTVQKHAERLHSLLEDLLTLSRLESKNPGLHREIVNIGKFLEDLVADYRTRPKAAEHSFAIHVDPILPELMADPLKLTQVFENLFDNALKYTPKGSTIEIRVTKSNGDIVISVKDNGPGIPPADLPHIFERFYRVDKGRSRETGGTGLGLSIVKHISQLHGGRAWAESELGKGTTFLVSLPVKSQQVQAAQPVNPA